MIWIFFAETILFLDSGKEKRYNEMHRLLSILIKEDSSTLERYYFVRENEQWEIIF